MIFIAFLIFLIVGKDALEVFSLKTGAEAADGVTHKANDNMGAQTMKEVVPLKDEPPIMFWRVQKVGSSSLLSLLVSYAFRNNITLRRWIRPLCEIIQECIKSTANTKSDSDKLEIYRSMDASLRKRWGAGHAGAINGNNGLSVMHDLCPISASDVKEHLPCAFINKYSTRLRSVTEIFMVREPIARAVSVYYFWGELFKLRPRMIANGSSFIDLTQFGRAINGSVRGTFLYHGLEGTAPSLEVMKEFVKAFPYKVGAPGPSYSYSAFTNDSASAVKEVSSERMVTMVLERMDESLIVLAHQLHWSLADLITVMPRKALSAHPTPRHWPPEGVAMLKQKLIEAGEFAVYDAAVNKLNSRVAAMTARGINITHEVKLLHDLRKTVRAICRGPELAKYRALLESKAGYVNKNSFNMLRDVEDRVVQEGHSFFISGARLYSYDICGPCEAHSLQEFGERLANVNPALLEGKANFYNCPRNHTTPGVAKKTV